MKEGKSLAEKNPCNSPPRSLGRGLNIYVRFAVAATDIRHLLPTPNRSSWPSRRPVATASRDATSAGGATPVIASQLDWTMNCQRFLFMI